MTEPKKRTRCAIYTRKSTEEGLDMEFYRLDEKKKDATIRRMTKIIVKII